MDPVRRMKSLIGYHVANDDSLIGMAMVQGRQREVVSIGLGIQMLSTKPRNTSVTDWAESQYHKVRLAPTFPRLYYVTNTNTCGNS